MSSTAATAATDLFLYGEIGDSWFWDDDPITAKTIAATLKSIPTGTPINLRINSAGGDLGEALAIYNLLNERREDVTTFVDGYALSAASFIALAGHRIISPASSLWMVHNPHTIAFGDAADMRHAADVLDAHREVLLSIYAEHTGRDEADLIQVLDEETWFTGTEAVEFGLATELAVEDLGPELKTENRIPLLFRAAADKTDREKIAAAGWMFQSRRRSRRRSATRSIAAAAVYSLCDDTLMANPENSELTQVRAEVSDLRAALGKTQAELEQTLAVLREREEHIQALTLRASVSERYNALRRQAEVLNREGKLSKMQFAKLFGPDPAADIEALAADQNHSIRLGRIEGAIEIAEAAEPAIQTSFRTEAVSEPDVDPVGPATLRAAREAIENAWRTH